METEVSDNIINALPTKGLFVSMLVRDIGTARAIIDLVDNAVDGARRTKPDDKFTGLWIRLTIDKHQFRIADNCGGMTIDTARKYAFRFGRPSESPRTAHSVGQFGVGMKRALFKLGDKFSIESTTKSSLFKVDVDVNSWQQDDKWEFEFSEIDEFPENPEIEGGTIITVSSLYPGISNLFDETFLSRFRLELEDAHLQIMDQGLAISVNGIPLKSRPLTLLQATDLKPIYKEVVLGNDNETKVNVKLYAGISDRNPSEAGWYVFCNGRLLLGADQSLTTGWGENQEATLPKYHNVYARFRGYAFFDSDDTSQLPWNTTKTGVDADSPKYRTIRLEMITMTRSVLNFLSKLDAERQNKDTEDPMPLEMAVTATRSVRLQEIIKSNTFIVPQARAVKPPPSEGRIQYWKPRSEIDRVKEKLNVTTYKDVGEMTFDYFLKMECED